MPEQRNTHIRPCHSIELTIVRLKEFLREPDAVFWVFAFPLLLTSPSGSRFAKRLRSASRSAW